MQWIRFKFRVIGECCQRLALGLLARPHVGHSDCLFRQRYAKARDPKIESL
jgi:hypothetical protein